MILAYVENKKIATWRIDISHVAIEQESLDYSKFDFDLSQCTIIGIRFPFIMRQIYIQLVNATHTYKKWIAP